MTYIFLCVNTNPSDWCDKFRRFGVLIINLIDDLHVYFLNFSSLPLLLWLKYFRFSTQLSRNEYIDCRLWNEWKFSSTKKTWERNKNRWKREGRLTMPAWENFLIFNANWILIVWIYKAKSKIMNAKFLRKR